MGKPADALLQSNGNCGGVLKHQVCFDASKEDIVDIQRREQVGNGFPIMNDPGNKQRQVEKKLLRVVIYGAQNLQAKSQESDFS